MGTAREHVDLIESWIPLVENPRRSNRVWICEEFGPVGGMAYYAWCQATQCVAAERLDVPFLHTASVGFAIGAAKEGRDGAQWIPRGGEIRVGDWVTYDYGPFHGKRAGDWANYHVAAIRNPSVQSRFETIGGNESDSIRISWQDRTHVIGFIRPAYSTAPIVPPTPEVDIVTDFAQATNGENRIERFSIDPDGAIATSWQATQGQLDYSPWTPLGDPPPAKFIRVAVSLKTDPDGSEILVVAGLTAFGAVWQIRQTAATPDPGYRWGAWTQVPVG